MPRPPLDGVFHAEHNQLAHNAQVDVHAVAQIDARVLHERAERRPMTIVFIIDISGSMEGPPLEQVCLSLNHLINQLASDDRVGIVAFSEGPIKVASLAPCTEPRKRTIRRRLGQLKAGGRTNLESGLRKGFELLRPQRSPDTRQVVLLLSDGVPNLGTTSPRSLAAMVQRQHHRCSVTAMGYGPHHDEDLLQSIARAGGGRYQYIADPVICAFEFARALGALGQVVAEGVTLELQPNRGVLAMRVLGRWPTRCADAGLKVMLPDAMAGSSISLTIALTVDLKRHRGLRRLLEGRLSYWRAGHDAPHTEDLPLIVQVAEETSDPNPVIAAQVALSRAEDTRQEARILADAGRFDEAVAALRRADEHLEALPSAQRSEGSFVFDAQELLRDEAAAFGQRPKGARWRTMRRRSMTHTFTLRDMTPASYNTPLSRSLVSTIAGSFPRAYLEVLNGEHIGQRHPLGVHQILGRTATADVRLADPHASRFHAEIAAQQGVFMLVDSGGRNRTCLNGRELVRPEPLSHGAVLCIGETLLKYCET